MNRANMPAMNGLPGESLESELLHMAMDCKKGEEQDVLDVFLKMHPVQRKAIVATVRWLLEIIEPHEPRTWRGINKSEKDRHLEGMRKLNRKLQIDTDRVQAEKERAFYGR